MKQNEYIWMLVSADEYALPEVIAESAEELARKCRVKKSAVYNGVRRKHSKWIKIPKPEEDDDE